MALTDYAGLQASIVRWAMRDGDAEFTAQVPDFITLAEARLNSDLRVSAMEKTATLTPDGSGNLSLPTDYLEWRGFNPGTPGYAAPSLVSPSAQVGRYPGGGVPSQFSVSGNVVSTYPTASGPVAVTYYARIPALSSTNTTNWLLNRYPNCYLYASLLEGAPYMEDDAQMQRWATAYTAAVAGVQHDDVGARYANGVTRVRSQTP